MAWVSLILGAIGFLLSILNLTSLDDVESDIAAIGYVVYLAITFPLAIAAIAAGWYGRRKSKDPRSKTLATAGILVGTAAILASTLPMFCSRCFERGY